VQRVVYELTEGDFGSRIGRDQAGPLAGLMRSLDDLSGVFQRWSAAARASERRYRLLYEHSPAALFRTRLDGRMLECNQAAVTALGYDRRPVPRPHHGALRLTPAMGPRSHCPDGAAAARCAP
jgi:PAS domain-containing protein